MTRIRILLTDKAGQVGYELERSLQGLGEIISLDRSQLDLANLAQVRGVIRQIKRASIGRSGYAMKPLTRPTKTGRRFRQQASRT